MNTARRTIAGFAALSWRKFTILAALGVLIGLAFAMVLPLRVS